jgi:hypothetical protein
MNPFQECKQSPVREAQLAYSFWELTETELLAYTEWELDLPLWRVYTEWLNEYCAADLRGAHA